MPPHTCPSIPRFPSNLVILGLSQDGQPYSPPLDKVSRDTQVTWPFRDYPRMDSHIAPLVQVSRDSQVTRPSRDYLRKGSPACSGISRFPSNLDIPGLSVDYPRMDSHILPLVQVSRDSQVTWHSRDYPKMDSHIPSPCPSIPGFPSNLGIPGLSQDGQPYTFPLVQVSRDYQVTWPSRDYPRMDSHMPPLYKYPGIPK